MLGAEVHDEWMSKNHPRCPVCSEVCTKIRDYKHLCTSDGDGTPVKPLSLALEADPGKWANQGADPRAKAHTLANQETQATIGREYGRPATFDSCLQPLYGNTQRPHALNHAVHQHKMSFTPTRQKTTHFVV